jgi:hypothetical protein
VSGDVARPVDDGLYGSFAAFVDEHRAEIDALVATHTTQTNEPRRTVVTLPALGLVASAAGEPLALLEVGASAGLNLLIDRYGFRIGSVAAGDPSSPVQLACTVEGNLRPPVPAQIDVAWRLGIDLNPLDVADPDTRAWLRALIWPEHRDRMAVVETAIQLALGQPPPLLRADLTVDLAAIAERVPSKAAMVVTSTWTLAYVEAERRRAFATALGDIARQQARDVWLVAGEGRSILASLGLDLVAPPSDGSGGPSMLALCRFGANGTAHGRLLAECHAHGRWIRWLDADSADPDRADPGSPMAARAPA